MITGAAGFIGFHTSLAFLERGASVVGIDNINSYYDPSLKRARLEILEKFSNFIFLQEDISKRDAFKSTLNKIDINGVVHLAAQAGVRHSFEHPEEFIPSNLSGFYNVAELAVERQAEHFIFASSSSVYGGNPVRPFSETGSADHPLSLYAATKKANEVMAHALAHINGLPTTGLRFFTVYGPWGRPDMSFFRFARQIIAGEPIKLHNHGKMTRDFTYIDDIVSGLLAAYDRPASIDPYWAKEPTPASSGHAPFRLFNLGSSNPVNLETYVQAFEAVIGKKAIREYVEMHPGEAIDTESDTNAIAEWTGCRPSTSLNDGIAKFVAWYRKYYNV